MQGIDEVACDDEGIEHADHHENIACAVRLIADGTPIEGDQGESSQRQNDKDRGRSDQVERYEQLAEGRGGHDGRGVWRDDSCRRAMDLRRCTGRHLRSGQRRSGVSAT